MSRLRARVDENQPEIVAALRSLGATVFPTHDVGKGFPDITVGFRGQNFMLELKDGNKPPSRQKLTPAEEEFHQLWAGQVDVVNSPEAAINLLLERTSKTKRSAETAE